MKRYDVTAKVGRNKIIFPKEIENDTGKYVHYKDAKVMLDLLVDIITIEKSNISAYMLRRIRLVIDRGLDKTKNISRN